MIWVLSAAVILLLILVLFLNSKINRLIKALSDTNKSLNETREMVAKQERALKRSGLYQNR